MTNDERFSFLTNEIDKLLSARMQSRILLKKNDYEFIEKRATIWLNKNPSGEVPVMGAFSFQINEKRKVTGVQFRGIDVLDIENYKRKAA